MVLNNNLDAYIKGFKKIPKKFFSNPLFGQNENPFWIFSHTPPVAKLIDRKPWGLLGPRGQEGPSGHGDSRIYIEGK